MCSTMIQVCSQIQHFSIGHEHTHLFERRNPHGIYGDTVLVSLDGLRDEVDLVQMSFHRFRTLIHGRRD